MFSWFRRADNAAGQTGVYLSESGVAAAQILRARGDQKPQLTGCVYESGGASDSLVSAVRQMPSRKLPAVSVLPSAGYNLLLVEAPDVPDDELRAAVRWRIKDLIDFHIDDAVIDVFQMPSQGRGGPNQMMYAVAARADFVRGQVDILEHAGLKLEIIDIPELSLRNIAALLEEEQRGVALFHLAEAHGVLLFVKQGVMYLTRRIETGVRTLCESEGLRSELVAGLALEMRRSLDYFESHYEQTPIPVLYTSGLEPQDQDQLTQELGMSVRNLSLTTALDCDVELDIELQRLCLPAIGAALRRDSARL
jgi:MSHA biogenesis protein MshI